jgi:hypothetical protein
VLQGKPSRPLAARQGHGGQASRLTAGAVFGVGWHVAKDSCRWLLAARAVAASLCHACSLSTTSRRPPDWHTMWLGIPLPNRQIVCNQMIPGQAAVAVR